MVGFGEGVGPGNVPGLSSVLGKCRSVPLPYLFVCLVINNRFNSKNLIQVNVKNKDPPNKKSGEV